MAALTRLLRDAIVGDPYPFSSRICALQQILDMLDPPLIRETPPPLKVYAPPRAKAGQRRWRR